MDPVPGCAAGTPYGARGPYWSCDRDQYGHGIHTGVDYPAPEGTDVCATRPGRLGWCDHGTAFGDHQVEVVCSDGTRDFYAHMCQRVADGLTVTGGQRIGAVGSEGNATGPHLHFERHAATSGGWSCAVVRDPAPSIGWENPDMPLTDDDLAKIRGVVKDEMNKQRPSYVSAFLAGQVNKSADTVKEALRIGLDHARGQR